MKEREVNYLSFLQVIATLAVVVLHTNGCYWDYRDNASWMSANVIECLMFFAVPMFFMVQGVTLLDYRDRYDTKTFLMKRIKKVFVPFLFWSFVAMFWCMTPYGGSWVHFRELSVSSVVRNILDSKYVSIYWYFIPQFCVYLSIPLFASVKKGYKKEIFSYLVVFGFLLNTVWVFADSITSKGLFSNYLKIEVVSGYIFFVVLGYLLANSELSNLKRLVLILFGILGFFLHLFGTSTLSREAGTIVRTYKGYCNVPSVLYAIAVFIVLKWIWEKWLFGYAGVRKLIGALSRYTFSIYLIHWYVMVSIQKFFGIDTYRLIWRLGAVFLIVPVSVLIAFLIRKIPILKIFVPE